MLNWESLIAARMRPCVRLAEDDPSKRNRRNRERRRDRTEYRKKYRAEHHDEIIARHHEYNASEHGRKVNAEYNKEWREKNRQYDKERKAAWWRKTHPNPRPIGRPRKNKDNNGD